MSATVTVCFRIPVKADAAMRKLAKASRRSLNAEVVVAIERYANAPGEPTEGGADQRCKRCGFFEWTRMHHATCVKPPKVRSVRAKKGGAR